MIIDGNKPQLIDIDGNQPTNNGWFPESRVTPQTEHRLNRAFSGRMGLTRPLRRRGPSGETALNSGEERVLVSILVL